MERKATVSAIPSQSSSGLLAQLLEGRIREALPHSLRSEPLVREEVGS